MKRWKVTNGSRPVEVECAQRGRPHWDADGGQQHDDTHFDTEAEAWAAQLAEVQSTVRVDATLVRDARKTLATCEAQLVESTLRRDEAERAYAEREAAGWR